MGDRNGWIQAGLLTAFGLASRAGSLLAVLGGSGVLLWQQVDWVRCDLATGGGGWQTALTVACFLPFMWTALHGAWIARRYV